MTIAARKGFENSLTALVFRILGGLPAKIAAYNAATSVTARTFASGPYTLGDDLTLKLTLASDGTERVGTIAQGIYTAQQLADAINADVDLSAVFTASVFFDQDADGSGDFVAISETAKGSAGVITLGDGTINSTLGWAARAYIWRWAPVQNIAEYHIWPTDFDSSDIADYPALRVWGDADPHNDTGAEMVYYRADMRLYCAYGTESIGVVDTRLGAELIALHDMIVELLYDSGRVAGVDAMRVVNSALGPELETTEAGDIFRGYVDFVIELDVQENLNC